MLEKEISADCRQYVWPDNYYMETDGMRRKEYLNEALKKEDSHENRLRQKLWEKRYTDARGRYDKADHFLRAWLDLPILVKDMKGIFGKSRVRKGVQEIRDTFLLDLLKENLENKDVWYREFVHLACFYIQVSTTDRSYTTTLFGIGKLPEDNLVKKIAADLCHKTITCPEILGFRKDQEVLAQAARDAFNLYYPWKEWIYEEAENQALSELRRGL